MVEKIALPFDAGLAGDKPFPVIDQWFQSGLTRKGDDGMQMIRHEEAQLTKPFQLIVIVSHGPQN